MSPQLGQVSSWRVYLRLPALQSSLRGDSKDLQQLLMAAGMAGVVAALHVAAGRADDAWSIPST